MKTTLEVFAITKEVQGQPRTYYFTSHHSPVTADGIQYIPLSAFDQEAWGIANASRSPTVKDPSSD